MQHQKFFLLLPVLMSLIPRLILGQVVASTPYVPPTVFNQTNATSSAIAGTVDQLNAIHTNPALMSRVSESEIQASYHPLGDDFFDLDFQIGLAQPKYRAFASFGLISGEGKTSSNQATDGLANDITDRGLYFSLAKEIGSWLSVGGTAKYLSSEWGSTEVRATAFDVGMAIHTPLFSPNSNTANGLSFDFSLLNLGDDIAYPVGALRPVVEGSEQMIREPIYRALAQQIRVGFLITPYDKETGSIKVGVHAAHLNDGPEELQVGFGWSRKLKRHDAFYFQAGSKVILENPSTFKGIVAAGLLHPLSANTSLRIEYAFSSVHTARLGLVF